MEENKSLIEENKHSILEAELDFRLIFEKIIFYKKLMGKKTRDWRF